MGKVGKAILQFGKITTNLWIRRIILRYEIFRMPLYLTHTSGLISSNPPKLGCYHSLHCDSSGGRLVRTSWEGGEVIDVWILNGPVKCSYIREDATKKWLIEFTDKTESLLLLSSYSEREWNWVAVYCSSLFAFDYHLPRSDNNILFVVRINIGRMTWMMYCIAANYNI